MTAAGRAAHTQREGRGRQSRSDDKRRGPGHGGRRRQRGATEAEEHRGNDRSEWSQVVGWAARSEDERRCGGGGGAQPRARPERVRVREDPLSLL